MHLRQPPSPCTGICRIDPASGECEGCRRTLTEIADWPMLSVREKDALLWRLKERREGDDPGRPDAQKAIGSPSRRS